MIDLKEKKYFIYEFTLNWIQDGEHDEKYPKSHKGLKKGRVRNSVSKSIMFKNELSDKEARVFLNKFYKKNVIEKETIKHPYLIKKEYKFLRKDNWCLHWFNHWTFDEGQTDEEVISSFENFVYEKEEENRRNGQTEYHIDYSKPYYCLMGAEDRWRWSSVDDNGNQSSKIPCRCAGCRKNGIISINH